MNAERPLRGGAMGRSALTLGLVAAGLAVTPGVAAAASWSPVGSLPTTDAASSQPLVSARPDGAGAAAAWAGDAGIYVSTIGRTGGWSAPKRIADGGSPTAIEYGTQGRLVVAGIRRENFQQRVMAVTRLASGEWTSPELLSPVGQYVRQVNIVMGRGGKTDLAWVQSDTTGIAAVATARTTIGASTPDWKTGTLEGSGKNVVSLSLAVGRGGNDSVRAAWDDGLAVRTASHTATGEWGTTTSFETPADPTFQEGAQPNVAVDSKGRNTVIYKTPSGIVAKRRSPGRTWTTTAVPGGEQFRNEAGGQFVSDVSLGVKPDGTALVYFIQSAFAGETSTTKVQRVALPLTGQASATTLGSSTQNRLSSLFAGVGVDDNGDDVAYWNEEIDTPETFEINLKSGGSLAGPTIANLRFGPPRVDAAGNGNAIVTWPGDEGLSYIIRR